MNEENLINHYNKHNESKRLKNKHANIEFITAMKYIHEYVKPGSSILDIGAAMGAYSIPLSEDGFNVTAFELVKHNIMERLYIYRHTYWIDFKVLVASFLDKLK